MRGLTTSSRSAGRSSGDASESTPIETGPAPSLASTRPACVRESANASCSETRRYRSGGRPPERSSPTPPVRVRAIRSRQVAWSGAARRMDELYGHAGTVVLCMTSAPADWGVLPPEVPGSK